MSSKADSADKERVRKLLKDAFAAVQCPKTFRDANACGPVKHEVCLELRRDFYNYEPEEVHYMLPAILEDAMNSRTGDDIETNDIEMLVLQLNPLSLEEEIVSKNRLQQFGNFTHQQTQAVCEWLRLARSWEDLHRYTDWVDGAINYWCGRASEANANDSPPPASLC